MRGVDLEPPPRPPVYVLRCGPTTDLGHLSQTEAAQGGCNSSDADTERIESLILEQDQLSILLNNASQRLSELEEELNVN